MALPRVEKITLPSVHLPFLETAPYCFQTSTLLLWDDVIRWSLFPTPGLELVTQALFNQWKLLLHNYSCGFTNVHLLQIDLIKMNLEISVGPTRKNWVFLSTGISEYVSLEPKANREKAKPRLKDPNDILSVTKSDHTWSQIYSQAFQLPEPINQYISLIAYARLNLIFSVIYKIITGTSLVVQWLRLHLPRQGM